MLHIRRTCLHIKDVSLRMCQLAALFLGTIVCNDRYKNSAASGRLLHCYTELVFI